jgi:phosphoribosylformylglycinamidine synthase
MNRAISDGLLHSSHTPTLGGLAVAFALPAVGGNLGADIDLSRLACDGAFDDDTKLFSESNSRFVVTCAPEKEREFESLFGELPYARIGRVAAEKRLLVAGEKGRRILDIELEALRRAFKETLDGV